MGLMGPIRPIGPIGQWQSRLEFLNFDLSF